MNPNARSVQVERRAPGARNKLTAPKIKGWSHQDELREKRGLPVTLVFTDGFFIEGILADADQFTIKLRLHDPNGQSSLTYFKHDIRSYQFAE